MGIIIRAEGGNVLPFPIEVMLICDEATAMFCRGNASFKSPDGLIGARTEASKAGWLERQSSRGGLWVCPECSGKASIMAEPK